MMVLGLVIMLASACKGVTDVTGHFSVTSSTSKDHLEVIVNGIVRGQVYGGYGFFDAPVSVPIPSANQSAYDEVVGVTVVIRNVERGTISLETNCQAGGKITTRIKYEITQYHSEGETSCVSS
jgi:hypothetical protein